MKADAEPARSDREILVAGIGNVFLGDDGFGVEVVRRLCEHPLPPHAEAVDFGVRGVHLAYRMLDGYRTVVLVDATARGGTPGTVYLIDATAPEPAPRTPFLDGHQMTPDTVLALLDALSAGTGGERPRRVLVLGCEPAAVEEGIGLSEPVSAAVEEAVRRVRRIVDEEPRRNPPPEAAEPVDSR